MKLGCIIIEDEPAGRKILEEYVNELNFLELKQVFDNPIAALDYIKNTNIDLMFLDIQMPKLNGIDFLKTLPSSPLVILTTAYSEYALQGFDLDVVDYLLKPIPFDRFIKACNKANEIFENKVNSNNINNDYFYIKCNNKYEKVIFDDVLFIEAANNYVIVQTKTKKLITYLTFKGILDILPKERFLKVHKSFIVSIKNIDKLDAEEIIIQKFSIPISRNLKDEIFAKVLGNNLVKR